MLNMESLLRPFCNRFQCMVASLVGVVGGEQGHDPGELVNGRFEVSVAALFSLLGHAGAAGAQLIDIAAVEEAPGGENLRGVELPHGAWASLANDVGGLVADGDAGSE